MYNIPILFLIFCRPDTTEQVFEQIRAIKPARLYVAADAPRAGRPDEAERAAQARAITEKVDWPCEVKTLYREQNLGCKRAVSEAISWFFEQEEYGVILEDDCLPHPSFFPYCEELLLRYKDDQRIGHISGNCFLPQAISPELSYDFCSVTHIWGWATWRRVWKNFSLDFPFWEATKNNPGKRKSLFRTKREEIYFTSFVEDTLADRYGISAWDVQYYFMLRTQNQLSIYPSVNLVTNIGLNSVGATHATRKKEKQFVSSQPIALPLTHPVYVMDNKDINEAAVKGSFFSYKRLARYYLNKLTK